MSTPRTPPRRGKTPPVYGGQIDATPEEIARAIFAGARAPDPSRRRQRASPRPSGRRSEPTRAD